MGGYTLMHTKILQSADNFQASTVTHMSQSGKTMSAKVALADEPLIRAVKYCAPFFQLPHSVRSMSSMEFRHPPLV